MNTKKLDPFNYTKMDTATILLQIAMAATGVYFAIQGDLTGLLALGALLGGGKGTLMSDLTRLLVKESNTPLKKTGGFIRLQLLTMVVLLATIVTSMVLMSGCGVDRQFVIDSRHAVLDQAGDYLSGCQQATIAPAFSVDWNDEVSYGGGIFAGCESKGRLLEFRCEAIQDGKTGKTGLHCDPLARWEKTSTEASEDPPKETGSP